MTSKGSCCCCSRCGVPLPKDVELCCLCVCDTLCITLLALVPTGIDECDCVKGVKTLIPWNASECAYVGSISCGTISIDLRFDIKRCSGTGDLGCHLCLTSVCLGYDGECASSGGEGCQPFEAGNKNGDCGDYLRDCTQLGGFDETWNIDPTPDCESGDLSGLSMSIRAECYPRVNPAGTGTSRLCKDCDCVCEFLQFEYEEDLCYSQVQIIPWAGGWSATFVGCPGGDQTIDVELQRGVDGCCYWLTTISRGTIVDEPLPATMILTKTDCPDVSISFAVDLGGEVFGLVDINCASCDTSINCCPILLAFPELDIVVTCSGGTDPFTDSFAATGSPGSGWSGGHGDRIDDFLFNCVDGVCGGSGIYTLSISLSISGVCEETLTATQEHDYPCCPLDLTFEFESECCGTLTITIKTPPSVPCPNP